MMADYYRLPHAAGMPTLKRVCDAADYCSRHVQWRVCPIAPCIDKANARVSARTTSTCIERVRSRRTPTGRIRCPRIRWNRSVLHHAARAPHVAQPAVTHALNPLRAHFDDPFPLLAYWQESRDTDRTHQRGARTHRRVRGRQRRHRRRVARCARARDREGMLAAARRHTAPSTLDPLT
ncbi:hypothetical protein LGM42_18820 [Burkholderia sp. AU39826]|uniref:hypothetical protein n=1 Tax=Burkholderia sp. AU39826 TaxID=2879634 RepID=UPI001CF1D2D1|nr:hypothetical protein [Burkholderia sp. AU39826]